MAPQPAETTARCTRPAATPTIARAPCWFSYFVLQSTLCQRAIPPLHGRVADARASVGWGCLERRRRRGACLQTPPPGRCATTLPMKGREREATPSACRRSRPPRRCPGAVAARLARRRLGAPPPCESRCMVIAGVRRDLAIPPPSIPRRTAEWAEVDRARNGRAGEGRSAPMAASRRSRIALRASPLRAETPHPVGRFASARPLPAEAGRGLLNGRAKLSTPAPWAGWWRCRWTSAACGPGGSRS